MTPFRCKSVKSVSRSCRPSYDHLYIYLSRDLHSHVREIVTTSSMPDLLGNLLLEQRARATCIWSGLRGLPVLWALILVPLTTERQEAVQCRNTINYCPWTRISPHLLPLTLMSSTTTSSTNFQSILDAALLSYATQTGIDITKHPSADKLQHCHSPEDVIRVLLERETAFKNYRDKHCKLIDCLRPVVQIVHKFSNFLGEVAGLVSFG